MTSTKFKRTVAALALGGATLLLGGAAAGTVSAQQAPVGSPPPLTQTGPGANNPGGRPDDARHEQFLAAVAQKLNVTTDQLKQAMGQARQELGLPDRPAGAPGGSDRGGFMMELDAAARAIGISDDQLRQELAGKSLAEVAQAHNVNASTVAEALKAAVQARLDQAVAAGRLSADQANQLKQGLADRIDQQMSRQLPADGMFHGGRGPGADGAPGHDGPRPTAARGPFQGGARN